MDLIKKKDKEKLSKLKGYDLLHKATPFFFFAEVPKDMDVISSKKGIVMLQRLQRSLLDFR